MTFYEELEWRGLINQISSPDLIEKLNKGGLTFYIGTDPTADSLHLGHYSSFLITRRLRNAGHTPILLVGLVVLFFAINSSDSRYVSFVGKKSNPEGYFVYVEEGDRLLCLRCPDRQMYDSIQADKHQFYSIQYRWNRLTYEGTLQTCKSEGELDFYTPMDTIGSSIGIDSLLGISHSILETKNAYPDPNRKGSYLSTYRFFYKGDGSRYHLGVATDETTILTIEDCRKFKQSDYDNDGIVELFVLTKYEEAPYILYELQDGEVVSCFVDEVPSDVLEWFALG